MTSKTLKDMRKELLDKYSGKLTGYEHLADGTGEYAKNVPEDSEKESEEKYDYPKYSEETSEKT